MDDNVVVADAVDGVANAVATKDVVVVVGVVDFVVAAAVAAVAVMAELSVWPASCFEWLPLNSHLKHCPPQEVEKEEAAPSPHPRPRR